MVVHERQPNVPDFSSCGLTGSLLDVRDETIGDVPTCFWCLTGRHFSGLLYDITSTTDSLSRSISATRYPW